MSAQSASALPLIGAAHFSFSQVTVINWLAAASATPSISVG